MTAQTGHVSLPALFGTLGWPQPVLVCNNARCRISRTTSLCMFHTRKLSFTRGILCGDLWGSVLLLVMMATDFLLSVWQPPRQYVWGPTNLYTEPKSPVPTLVPPVSEFAHCLLHAVLLRFLYSKHTGMKDVALCGKNHITLLTRKEGQQYCEPSFFLLAFKTRSITIPCLQP